MQAKNFTVLENSYRALNSALRRNMKNVTPYGVYRVCIQLLQTRLQTHGIRKQGSLVKEAMRIAVASEGLDVSSHFSCCTNFNYYKIEHGEMVDSRNLPSQGHLCGSQANFLRQIDVKVLICNHITAKEAESMERAGIKVVPGATGRAIKACAAYLEGKLNNPSPTASAQTSSSSRQSSTHHQSKLPSGHISGELTSGELKPPAALV